MMLSNDTLINLNHYGKSISIKNHHLDVSAAAVNSAVDELISTTPTNTVPRRFPFCVDLPTKASTLLDDLVVHPSIITLAAQALFSKQMTEESLSKNDPWFGYPRLLEAQLVAPFLSTSTTDIIRTSNESLLDAVVVTISFLASSPYSVAISRFQEETFFTKSTSVPELRIIFATSSVGRPDYGGSSFIRYLAGTPWIATLSPFQLASLGFPPPGHSYWHDPEALKQVTARYRNFGFDPTPYGALLSSEKDLIHESYNEDSKSNAPLNPLDCDPNQTCQDLSRLVDPDPVLIKEKQDGNREVVLSSEQIAQFRDIGYLFLENIFPQEDLENAALAANKLWPADNDSPPPSFGFPFEDPWLNDITLHPTLLSLMCRLLQIPIHELRLTQSACLGKKGTDDENAGNGGLRIGNQPIHLDFLNNTYLTPARSKFLWRDPEEVQAILYYSDHTEASGGTAFVPGLSHTGIDAKYGGWLPDDIDVDNDPRPKLYAMERKVAYKKGSILLYQLGTWHRGTPVLHGQTRCIHHLCFRKASCTWIGSAPEFGQPTITNSILSRLHVSHKQILGFSVAKNNDEQQYEQKSMK